MSNWARRKATLDLACDGCWGSIKSCEFFYQTSDGLRFCCDCPPEEDSECPL